MKVSSHTSYYRGVMVTIQKYRDCDGTLSVYAAIDGQVFRPIATDSFNAILKECRAEIDCRIDEQKVFTNPAENETETEFRSLVVPRLESGNAAPK